MNAPIKATYLAPAAPVAQYLSTYDHHGLTLDAYGFIDEDGYNVTRLTVHGTTTSVLADSDLLSYVCAEFDDTLPTAEELRAASAGEDRAERAMWNRDY